MASFPLPLKWVLAFLLVGSLLLANASAATMRSGSNAANKKSRTRRYNPNNDADPAFFVKDERLAPLVHGDDGDEVLIPGLVHAQQATLPMLSARKQQPQPEHLGRIVENKVNSQCLGLSHLEAAKHKQQSQPQKVEIPHHPSSNNNNNNHHTSERQAQQRQHSNGEIRKLQSNSNSVGVGDSLYRSHEYWVDHDEDQEMVADVYFYEHEHQHQQQQHPPLIAIRERAPPQTHRRLKETTKRASNLGMSGHGPDTFESMAGPAQQSATYSNAAAAVAADVEDAFDENSLIGLHGAQGNLRRSRRQIEWPYSGHDGANSNGERQSFKETGVSFMVGFASAMAVALIMLSCVLVILSARRNNKRKDLVTVPPTTTICEGSDSTERVSEIEDISDHDDCSDSKCSIGEYIIGVDIDARAAGFPTVGKSLPRCEIVLSGRTVGLEGKPHSPGSIVSALTTVEEEGEMEDVESGKSSQDAQTEDETSPLHGFSNMYTLIAKLMKQLEAAESKSEETQSNDAVASRRLEVEERFCDNNSLDVDHRRRHHQASMLVEEQHSEMAWTEFERQSSSECRAAAGTDDDVYDDDDDISLREYLRRQYGALSINNAKDSRVKGKVEL